MARKKPARRKTKPLRKSARRKSAAHKKSARAKKSPRRKAALRKRAARAGKSLRARRRARKKRRIRGSAPFDVGYLPRRRGLGGEAGGQSGDLQGLSRSESFGSESVEELAEEGQSFEAEVVSGVEDAPTADHGEVRTREIPEDDVPPEYRDKD